MPLDHDASKEIKKINDDPYKALRARMDLTMDLVRLVANRYCIPPEDGDWETFIPEDAATDSNKLTEQLAYATMKLRIPLQKEDSTGRRSIADTEYTAIGLLNLADSINEGIPDYIEIQGQLAALRVLRGWAAIRVVIIDDDGDLVPDVAVWDVRNTRWRTGKKRLSWVSYETYMSPEEAEEEYGWTGGATDQENKFVVCYDMWDCSEPGKPAEEGVIIKDNWVRDPEPVKINGKTIDYIPIRIKPCRSVPLINDHSSDNIQFVGEDFLTQASRVMLPQLSKLMSYKMTRASELAKSGNVFTYDSSLSDLPNEFRKLKDKAVKGRNTFLDKAKGEDLLAAKTPPNGTDIDSTLNVAMNNYIKGAPSGVAFGIPPYPDTAQGTDILYHATMDLIKPFKLGVEKDIAWLAQELVHQYKYGDFDESEFEGYDSKAQPFRAKIKPDKINDDWRFECKLSLDLLRDRAAEVGLADSLVKTGIASMETARDITNLISDPDSENEKIARERARSVFGIGEAESVLELIEDYARSPDRKKQFILNFAMMNMQKAMTQINSGPTGGNGAGIPGEMPPSATTGQMGMIPEPVREAARMQRLSMGGGR